MGLSFFLGLLFVHSRQWDHWFVEHDMFLRAIGFSFGRLYEQLFPCRKFLTRRYYHYIVRNAGRESLIVAQIQREQALDFG